MFQTIVLITQIVYLHFRGASGLYGQLELRSSEEKFSREKEQAPCDMRWSSKCLELIKHYRLKHSHTSQDRSLPWLYSDCPCLFKNWGALHAHLSRNHTQTQQSGQIVSFSCLVCNSCSFNTERQYFEHPSGLI